MAKYTRGWDADHEKTKAWWQDLGVILHVGLTCAVVLYSFAYPILPKRIFSYLALYLLLDMLRYHISVLWFDDLEICTSDSKRKVWSHRRILFQAFINFAETIFLFAVLYSNYFGESFSALIQNSFLIATTLNKPVSFTAPDWVVNCQILVSIFFLVVAISVISSIGYSRPELGKSFDD